MLDSSLTGGYAFAFALYFAFGKINCLSAPTAGVRAIEFIGKYFFFLTAVVTLANQCFEILKVVVTRAMLGS